MDRSKMVDSLLDRQLTAWHQWIRNLALDGFIAKAAEGALQLGTNREALQHLVDQLAFGAADALPPVELLPGMAMGGAKGAYHASAATIYLNADWLSTASESSVFAVLTEELGHHLDARLNPSDSRGDEGELFASLLIDGSLTATRQKAIEAENDSGFVQLNGGLSVAVEMSATGDSSIALPLDGVVTGTLLANDFKSYTFAANAGDAFLVHLTRANGSAVNPFLDYP